MTAADAALALLVFLAAASVDFAAARYSRAVLELDPHRSGRWSVMQLSAATVGFYVAVKVTMWMLPIEAVGYYVGSWLSVSCMLRARARDRVSASEGSAGL